MPSTLVDRIATKMGPHVRSEGAQTALLDRALYGFDVVRSKLMTGQPPAQFATACAATLLAHGRLADGTHPMVRVLEALRDGLGPDPDWHALIAEVNAGGQPAESPPLQPGPVPDQRTIRIVLIERFLMVELRVLVSDLGIDPENLAGEAKGAYALSIVTHFRHLARLPELVQAIRAARPGAL